MSKSRHKSITDGMGTGGWAFTPEVADGFDEHVRQSVPYYDLIQEAVTDAAGWVVPDEGEVVDFGASTGETLTRILARYPTRRLHVTAYDTSPAMRVACSRNVSRDQVLTLSMESDIRQQAHSSADLTLALFTLQFLQPWERRDVLTQAHERSKPGAALLVAEKVRVADSRWAEVAHELSWDYKVAMGIQADDVLAKARSLRGVLRPETAGHLEGHMLDAGWRNPTCLFRWHQWVLYGAWA